MDKILQYFLVTDPRDIPSVLKGFGIPDEVYDENLELGAAIKRLIEEGKLDPSVLHLSN